VHQWHLQRKRDAKLWRKEVWIALFKRRFRCRHCRKVFTEPDPACGAKRRTTRRLRETVGRWAQEATVRAVARSEGVSEGLVERSWLEAHAVVSAPKRPHLLLGLDGFCVRRPGRMWTGMWDLDSGQAVAVVPGERQVDTVRMLERHADRKSVTAVAIDLAEAYRQAVELVLPYALVVADKFHVLALAGRALREVHGERRRPGKLAWLLQRGVERLSNAERTRLVEALAQEPVLARAWGLKESLALPLQEAEPSRSSRRPGPLDRRGGSEQPASIPAHCGHPYQVTQGSAQLLALPYHQHPRRRQAQPGQDPEKEGLRLPERQELSAKNP